MSSSRLFNLFGTSIFRHHHQTAATTTTFLSSIPPFLRPLKPFPSSSSSLRFRRCCSSTAVLEADTPAISLNSDGPEAPLTAASHPWPEWVSFVDRLKTKGYFPTKDAEAVGVETTAGAGSNYTDMNLLKDVCLNFARDRCDIFKSLSGQEIQTIVDKGCPNLFRKAVNSAKRLRAHLGLDEGEVCSACHLRGSCDRAYVTLKESEAGARTVDVIRILLVYALDPAVMDGVKSEEKDIIEVSARNLLHEIAELSETTRAPNLQDPAVAVSKPKKKPPSPTKGFESQDVEMKDGDWICSQCNFMNFRRNVTCRKCGEHGPIASDDLEMKKGDWMCSECNFMNFAGNVRCLKCKADSPRTVPMKDVQMIKGDWNCPQCNFMNFARNVRCLKCKADGPRTIPMKDVQMKKGDWNCLQCNFMNFASNAKCLRCSDPRPKTQLRPGDWECPSCNFLNFKGNIACKKCNNEAPKTLATEGQEHIWKRPVQET